MFCKYCGKGIDSDTIFCPACGKNQTEISNNAAQIIPTETTASQNRPKISVSFFGSIKNYYLNYAHFNGRTVRSEFLWSVLYEFLYAIIVRYVIFKDIEISTLKDFARLLANDELLAIFYVVTLLLNTIPSISLRIRRLHDIGKSGWLYLWNLVPIIGTIILMVNLLKDSSFSDNMWGLSPYNIIREYDETKTWRCEKCGCRMPNSHLTCKTCGEIKPASSNFVEQVTPKQKSTKCVCGEYFYGQICPNCGRTKNDI